MTLSWRRGLSLLLCVLVALLLVQPGLAAPKPDKPGEGKGGGGGNGGGKGGGKGGGNSTPPQPWEENFDGAIDPNFWTMTGWNAPGYISGQHVGFYEPENVSLQDGYLVLKLTQETGTVDGNPDGVISHGAVLGTREVYGYGTYEMRVRMSSTSPTRDGFGPPVSGTVSAAFLYVNNSETEIDFEWSGHLAETPNEETLYMVNWYNANPRTGPVGSDSTVSFVWVWGLNSQFQTLKFVWEPGKITFYVNGVTESVHTTDVPSAPANFLINHWGTNNAGGWGGAATVGAERYFYVDWVRYTPLP